MYGNGTIVSLGNVLHYRKTKPGPTNIAGSRAVYAVKPFKDTISFFRRDADSAILDLD
jgi:hypothetical protein